MAARFLKSTNSAATLATHLNTVPQVSQRPAPILAAIQPPASATSQDALSSKLTPQATAQQQATATATATAATSPQASLMP